MRKIYVGIGVLIFLGILILLKTRDTLPPSFIAYFKADLTSSGGSREYTSEVTFKDGVPIKGVAHYTANTATSQHIEHECVVKAGEWVKVGSADRCEIPVVISLTKDGLEKQIQSGELVPAENCKHLQTCYNIVK